jgi:molybdopterin converting factor small subunit
MVIQALFFGATAQIIGTRKNEIVLSHKITASQLVERIIEDHPQLARHKLLFAINEEYAAGDTQIKDGDELAIFTAVSGG